MTFDKDCKKIENDVTRSLHYHIWSLQKILRMHHCKFPEREPKDIIDVRNYDLELTAIYNRLMRTLGDKKDSLTA